MISLLLFGFSSSFLSGLLSGGLGVDTTHERELGVLRADCLKLALFVKVTDEGTGNRAVDLELLAENSTSDAKNLWDFIAEFFVPSLVEEDIIIELILDLDLGPGLLFGFGTGFLGSWEGSLFIFSLTSILASSKLLLGL